MSDIRTFALRRPGWRVWLAGVLAVIVVVTVVIARIAGGSESDGGANAGDSPPGSAAEQVNGTESGSPDPSTTPETDGPAGAEATADSTVAASAAMTVALAFAKAWATRPAAGAEDQWWTGVSRYTDQTLAEQLRQIDPATLEATKVTGPARSAQGGVSSAEVQVPTDAGELLVICVFVGQRWQVADYELERRPS